MRIAMISEHASPLACLGGVDAGGQNVHVASLAIALAERGHSVTVYTRRDNTTLPERVELAPGVMVEHIVAGPTADVPKDELLPYMDAFGDQLSLRWQTEPPDIVHSHFWMSGLAALRAAAGTGIPVVHTFHALGTVKRRWQGGEDTSPTERLAAERLIGDRAARVIATCNDEVRELLDMGVRAASIEVVPCGVDSSLFSPIGPVAPRAGRLRLLMLSRMVPRKGIDDAIRAMQWINGAELLIVGGPSAETLMLDPEAQRLRALSHELGLDGRVHPLGRLPHAELPPLFRSADVVLTVPWYEPFGIVPLEAMASAVPVVATAVGGMLDTIVDGITGTLVAPKDPCAIARAVNALLADRPLREAMGAQGAARARSLYSWTAVARATEAQFAAAVAQADASRAEVSR